MKWLILAVLLSIMQAPSPVPRKATDSPARAGHDIKRHTRGNKEPPANPPALADAIATANNEHAGNSVRPEDAQQPIRVRELPPVSIAKDWSDWGIWAFNGLLVIVGFLQVCLLLGTLRAIQRQADLMERQTTHLRRSVVFARRSATATRKSVEALINAERPWIVPKIRKVVKTFKPIKIEGIDDHMPDTKRVSYFVFTITNLGRTPAEIVAIRGQPELTEKGIDGGFTDPPDYGLETILRRVKMLAPKERWEYGEPDLSTKCPDSMHIIFKGVILYRDTFKPEVIHETRFCYTYLRSLDEWVPSGPPDHTKYT